jgi:hypothetical protein
VDDALAKNLQKPSNWAGFPTFSPVIQAITT